MNEKFAVTIHRSPAWLREERIATGQNIPETLDVPIDPADLSRSGREFWLSLTLLSIPAYERISCVGYSRQWDLQSSSISWGHENLIVDGEVTAPKVEAAMFAARDKIFVEKVHQTAQEQKLIEAREVLADVLSQKDEQIAKLQKTISAYEAEAEAEAEADE